MSTPVSIRDSAKSAEGSAQHARLAEWKARERSLGLVTVLRHTAETLDQSANLAEEHARRHERHGQRVAADQEWQVASRARTAAERARAHAAEWQAGHPGSS